jgi:diguanylate cyclase (GGDEF)-like protein
LRWAAAAVAATALILALSGAVAGANPPSWAHGNDQGNGQGNGGAPPGQGNGGSPPGKGDGGTPPGKGNGGTPPGDGSSSGSAPTTVAPQQPATSSQPSDSGGPPGHSGNNPGHGGTPPGQQKQDNGPGQTATTSASAPTTVATTATTPTPTQTPISTPISTPPVSTTPSSPTTPGTTSPGPVPGIGLTSLAVRGSHGPLRSAAGAGGGGVLGSAASGVFAGNPLTTPLAPGTGGAGTTAAGTTTFSHRGQQVRTIVVPPGSSPSTVISKFVSKIPTLVWIVLGTALALAALGGVTAVAFGRRSGRRAGEVAAVSAAAITDGLTGALNRRGFTESAERELERARRYGHPVALAYVDVRGLKTVNDSEGHGAGDRLLREVALLLSQSARTHDLVGRMGGDELAVLLAEQSATGADAMSRRVREQVPERRAALGIATPWDVTIGTASFPEDGDTLDELLEAADRRMYEQRGIELQAG